MKALFSTERLMVRKFRPEDSGDRAEILTDKAVTYFEPYETFTREACIQEAKNFSENEEFYAVTLGEKVIGKIYFSKRSHGSYEIGYTFNAAYQGFGYASESVSGMMRYAFEMLGARRIIAEVNARNTRSLKLVERLGMRKEAHFREYMPRKGEAGTYDDLCVFAVLKNEREPLKTGLKRENG